MRETQIFTEEVGIVPSKENYKTRFTIQDHQADQAGRHYDYRLIIDGKAYSWASKYTPPKTTQDRFFMFQQPEHTPDYAGWSGDIPKGQYGAGKVTVILDVDAVIIKSSEHSIKLLLPEGEYEGIYSFLKKDGNNWLVVRNKELTYDWQDKDSYSAKIKDSMWNDENIIASEKKDGAQVIGKVTSNKGIGLVSVRKSSVDGELISKDNQVPHIAYKKVPKEFDGMVFRGELYFDNQPFSVLSGVLNSKPVNAIAAQDNLDEKIKLAPFDILKLPGGKDPSGMPYEEKLKLLKALEGAVQSEHIKVPEYTKENKKEFYENIIAKGGEGVILRDQNDPKFYKVKKEETYTLKIVDFTEGEGKYAGRGIGAFVVEDGKGRRVGKVGTGLTDQIRTDAYANFDNYRNKLIKVKMMEPTSSSMRAPRFEGWDMEKYHPDEMPF